MRKIFRKPKPIMLVSFLVTVRGVLYTDPVVVAFCSDCRYTVRMKHEEYPISLLMHCLEADKK